MKHLIFYFLFIILPFSSNVIINAQTICSTTDFTIHKEQTEADYQKYVGHMIVFYKPTTLKEEKVKLKNVIFGIPYTIQAITCKTVPNTTMITYYVRESNNSKAKTIAINCYKHIDYEFPAYLLDELQFTKTQYVGKKLCISGTDYSINNIAMEPEFNPTLEEFHMVPKFVYVDKNGNTISENMETALSGNYHSILSKVEKPINDSIRYGKHISISEGEELTKYNYVDNVIDITIFGNNEYFEFELKNTSESTIKIIWNEAVFIGIDGSTSKIMHNGIKYSKKEEDQPASIIIRGAKLNDIAFPTNSVYYENIFHNWHFRSYSPSIADCNSQVSLMLPIQIKETINEYIFIFDIIYQYHHPELH